MNTPRPTPFTSPTMPAPFHSSTRTALSQSIDPSTGLRTRVLRTSTLELAWRSGQLQIRCQATVIALTDVAANMPR